MKSFLMCCAVLSMASSAIAGERVSATNFYVVKQEQIPAGNGSVFWTEDNVGTFTVKEGPIDPGFARCIGSGFGGPGGVEGDGICVYGEGEDTFTMKWKIVGVGSNEWKIVTATGKYAGMTGSGTTKTRVDAKFLKLAHRISDWEGEINLPNQD